MIQEIAAHPIDKRPKCLLLGNGINRRFADPSWESIIKDELQVSGQTCTYEEIRNMPATMQIVVATADNVSSQMKSLSDRLIDIHMTKERDRFLNELMELPVDDILTANYSFELEMADGMPQRKSAYSSRLKSSFHLTTDKERSLRLFQYYETKNRKRIWHIHGDVAKPDTMLMGHYYYAKQLRAIQDCVGKTVRRYKHCEKEGIPFIPYSWVDQFLTGDVFILGFGMYLCESDLWYLTCCKRRNFPDTQTYFYDLQLEDMCQRKMLEAYHVQIVEGKSFQATSYETDYYPRAINDIRNRIVSESKHPGD